jgi:antitoxin ParD1/3/4
MSENGLYDNTGELVREAKEQVDGLKLDALRKELVTGAAQAEAGEFVEGDVKSILVEAKERRG